jgi:hypothetical protein
MATVPTVPNIVSLPRAQDGSIEFWWNPPTSDGGSAITGYTVSCSTPQLQTVLPASAFNTSVQGLTNGQNYTFFMTASNAVGESAPATWQAYQPGFIPSPPTGVGAVQEGSSCNILVSRSTPTTSTNTVNYWSVQATPADIQFSTIVQAEYGSNLTTFLTNLDTTQTQWQMSARQLTDPGWSDPSTKTPYIGNNRVRTAFATNITNNFTTISPGGDTWMLGQIERSTISTCVYNSAGNFVQAIPPQPVNSSYLMYSSADGVSNTWIALINGTVNNTTEIYPGQIDQNGNYCMAISIGGAQYHRFYDKNNTLILSNSYRTSVTNRPYVFKYSSNGVYNGINDSNTWAAAISTGGTLNVSGKMFNLDSSGNIFCGFFYSPGIGSFETTLFDKTGATIGNPIPFERPSGTANGTQLFFIKYAYDGLATNSWAATCSNGGGVFDTVYTPLTSVNSSNEFCAALYYSGNNGYIYDANQNPIGNVLPYTSTLSIPNYNTCICKFGVTGTSNDSWRAIIQSVGDIQYKNEVPISLMIDTNNKIIVSGYSESFTTGTNLIPLDKNDSSNVLVTQSTFAANNVFVTRYTRDGTPEWIATLGGASTIVGPSTIIGSANGNLNVSFYYTPRTVLDSQNNVYIVGWYSSNSLTMRNNTGSIINTISSPRSNVNIYIAKFSADGTTGALARLGSVSTVASFNTSNARITIDSSDSLYLIGHTATRYFGFYPASNPLEPSLSIDNPNALGNNYSGYVAKINSGLTTIQIGRIQASNTFGVSIYPSYITYDSAYNPIATYTTNTLPGIVSSFQGYCMGNYTTTPDYTIQTSNQNGIYANVISFLSRFTTTPTTSWTAIQGGISTFSANMDYSFYNNKQIYGSLYIDSNDRIYTTMYSSTTQFNMNVFDEIGSTVVSPQQVAGSSVIASTCAISMSYPIDGINRPQ